MSYLDQVPDGPAPAQDSLQEQPAQAPPAKESAASVQASYQSEARTPGHGRHWVRPYLLGVVVGAVIGAIVAAVAVPALYSSGFGLGLVARAREMPKWAAPSPQDLTPVSTADMPSVFVAARLGPAVVGIANKGTALDLFGRTVQRQVSGSGVIIATNGYIVTNNHVVDGATQLEVSLSDGRKFPATLVGTDAATDLAVIKVDADGLAAAELGTSNDLKVGEIAIAIGNPVGSEFQRSVTQGIISGLNRVLRVGDQTLQLIQTDAVINPGNSGGPLANMRGQVIGINALKLSTAAVEGMGFAIPIDVARPVINDLIAKGRVQRAYLGIWLIDKSVAPQYDIKLERGIYVADVAAGGPAGRAGIRKGDIILAIDSKEIDTADDFKLAIGQHRAGDRVEMTVLRGGQRVKLPVTLGEAPSPGPLSR